jgi:hypothetical protein
LFGQISKDFRADLDIHSIRGSMLRCLVPWLFNLPDGICRNKNAASVAEGRLQGGEFVFCPALFRRWRGWGRLLLPVPEAGNTGLKTELRNHSGTVAWACSQSKSGSSGATEINL